MPVAVPLAAAPFAETYHVLLAMVVVIALSRLLGVVARWLRQPQVIADVAAGILLGPSLLGWIWPAGYAHLFPEEVVPYLRVMAQLGAILYMFLVGLELNTAVLRERGRHFLAIATFSMAVPFVLGLLLAMPLYAEYAGRGVSRTVFGLFMGVALSVTAFPVLARVLSERNLTRTPLGELALTCAAAGDVVAWCLLAVVVGLAQADLSRAGWTVVLSVVYVGVMLLLVRPLMRRLVSWIEQRGEISRGGAAIVFWGLLLSALATEWIGIHAIFGAFLLGAVIPHDGRIARTFVQRLEDLVAIVLLPAFFAFVGIRAKVGLIQEWGHAVWCLGIVTAATIGKLVGCAAAGRLARLDWTNAAAIGALMNTRGLMELIVLNVALELGVISPTLFAMLVFMALATTMMTAPALDWLAPRASLARQAESRQAVP